MPKQDLPIVIAGAGPAGSTLAIRLARQGRRVVLVEREKFPRQKLCGEFISPECLAHFGELGVLDEMLAAGGDRIFETRFFGPDGRSIGVPSDWFGTGSFAMGLSRARMDHILLEKARESGVEVIDEASVVGLRDEDGSLRSIKARGQDGSVSEIEAAIAVDATGRSRVLSKLALKLSASNSEPRPRFVGFKAHLTGIEMPAGVCEIYAFKGGYAGLSFVENAEGNLCFLAKASLLKGGRNADTIVDEVISQNLRASETLSSAVKVHDWLAVSIPGFGVHRPPPMRGLYTVGKSRR